MQVDAIKAVVYGPGGIGKSELCANIKQIAANPLVLDVGDSTQYIDVDRISGITTYDELRSVLHDDSVWVGREAVIIDDLTAVQEMALAWTLANIKHEKGHYVSSINGYGYGKGHIHLCETFLLLLGDLDAHHRRGRHCLCTAHDCTAKVPNPTGEDFIRYEPRLQNSPEGNIRSRVREWAYHLLFVGYDTFVNESGKASGGGSRTIYTREMPTHIAKHRAIEGRTIPDSIVYDRGSAEIWNTLLGKE